MTTVQFQLGGTLKFVAEAAATDRCRVTLRYDNFTVTAGGNKMAYVLPADKQVHVQVSYVDASGNPATIDGDVTWDSSNETLVEVIVDSSDSTKAIVRAKGEVGQAQVTALADADLDDEGTREIATTMDVTLMAGEAVAGTITPEGEAEDIPQVEHHRR